MLHKPFTLSVPPESCWAAGKSSMPAGGGPIPKLEFEKCTLANGLDVISSRITGCPMVAVNLWYHVGPANEAAGLTGFAHLFEHMMFEGSKHVAGNSHFRHLEAAGASDINGTTDFDRTNYFETLPANQLELALWLESDRMGYLLDQVDQPSLSNQQDVVRNERRQSIENALRPGGDLPSCSKDTPIRLHHGIAPTSRQCAWRTCAIFREYYSRTTPASRSSATSTRHTRVRWWRNTSARWRRSSRSPSPMS
jgi:hypothetical protein